MTALEIGQIPQVQGGVGAVGTVDSGLDDVFILPPSFAQQRLWFLEQLGNCGPAYNIPSAFALTGPLDVAALGRALDEIARRHETLRTSLPVEDGQPVQRIVAEQGLLLPITDLRDVPEADREATALRLVDADARQPFDLATGPLLRATLLRLADDEHVLTVTMHHTISDGWSLGVFANELGALYDAFIVGNPSPLPALPLQYADYVLWEREWLQGEVLHSQLDFWKQRLAGELPVLALPVDRPRPAAPTYRGSWLPIAVPAELTTQVKALSQREGVTTYTTLLAAFYALLHRYSGQEDLIVGALNANRNRSELEGLIGFFINTLVLRADLSGDPSFRDLLRRVRDVVAAAMAYQDVPFEKLVEGVHPERHSAHNPLFQAVFSLQNAPMSLDLAGLSSRTLPIDNGTSDFDLFFELWEEGGGIRGMVHYSTDLFDRTTIERFSRHFQTLLAGLVAAPERPVSAAPLLECDERQELLTRWNATEMALADGQTVVQLIEAQAERTPGAPAVVGAGEQLTYRELDSRANQLARHLRGLGVEPGMRVAIALDRTPALVIGLLGILKAGGAYVPLDPAYPAERLAYMLEDSAAPVLLAEEALLAALPTHGASVVCLDRDWPTIARESAERPEGGATPRDLAYVIYTSGSTGKPKGVMVPHRALVNFLLSMRREPGLTADDALLAVTTLSFDIAGLELYLPLIVGARVILASRAVATDGAGLAALLSSSKATALQATPATWRLLIDGGWHGQQGLKALCGGEALPRDLADALLARCDELWNVYGPTETTIWSTVARVTARSAPITIGGPIANTQVHILDGRMEPVPVGVPGELCIGGDGVADGYLGRPALTAERFVADPFSARPGARLYRTGDLARRHADGQIEHLGRLDFQVKVRGYRIELGEIEAALLAQPGVRRAVVVAREDLPGDRRLVAYIIPAEGDAPSAATLRNGVRGTLPEYMVPAAFVTLDALPLTPNGKVDRKALTAPATLADVQGETFEGARDAFELQMATIWEKVLNRHPIGINDNFFDLGGHSLLAVRLFTQIEHAFGKSLPLATLFEAPTIATLTALLRQRGWEPAWSSLVALHAGGTRPPLFCVHGVGGNVLNFHNLAQHLGSDQPVYGLQARGLDGKEAPDTRVEDMAAHYLRELRELQPTGPYYLGGMCFGGMVALEMAQQLQAAGEMVALLAMFDDYAPGYMRLLSPTRLARFVCRWTLQRSQVHLRNMVGLGARAKVAYVGERAHTVARRTRSRVWGAVARLSERQGQPLPQALQDVREAGLLAQRQYRPHLYHGQPILFIAEDRAEVDPDPQFGWGGRSTGGIEVHFVPGDHITILEEPNVQVLADQLRACLDRAQQASSPTADTSESVRQFVASPS